MSAAGRPITRSARRIVVKVGSSTLTRDGELRKRVFTNLARQISQLCEQGRDVVLVTSGAIAAGSHELGWDHPGRSIPEKQAAAAVGQIGLLELYRRRFATHQRTVAQVLLTRSGLQDRERFLNARHTFLELLKLGVVPIVNENDTVATEEIRFGDNDDLSATIVNLIGADLLIILTDVDGFHEHKPVPGQPMPPLVDVVEKITPEIERAAEGSASEFGRGGMITKVRAARTAALSGAATVLCNGKDREIITKVCSGDRVGTLFLPAERLNSRKHWLAFTTRTRGELIVDAGAVRALRDKGKSLLPAGIVEVRGKFRVGDSVSCVDPEGREIARGLAAYDADDVRRIQGAGTQQIARVLGYSNGNAVIHRDDMVLLAR